DLHLVRICAPANSLFGHFAVVGRAFVLYASAAEMHQHLIHRKPVKPRREGRVAPKTADLAEKLDENFLCKVFGLGLAARHSQAEGVGAAVIAFVDDLERGKIAICSIAAKLDVRSRFVESLDRLEDVLRMRV